MKYTLPITLSTYDRVWLGVIGGVSQYFQWNPRGLRRLVFFLGLLLGPFLLWAYLIGYFVLYFAAGANHPPAPRIRWGRVLLHFSLVVCGLLVVRLSFSYAVEGLQYGYTMLLKEPFPDLTQWDWLRAHEGRLTFWMLLLILPISLLGALPCAHGWDRTFTRLAQALFALLVSTYLGGAASLVAGLLVHLARNFTGVALF